MSKYTDLTPVEVAAFQAAPVDRSGECWVWLGTRSGRRGSGKDYGFFGIYRAGRRVSLYAHRLLLTLRDGVEPGMACHTCDNPPCVRPSHLYSGTAQTNYDDARERGRLRGGAILGSKRPDTMRRLVAELHAGGGITATEWSDEIGSWRSLEDQAREVSTLQFIGRLEHGGRLPEIVA